MNIDEKLIEHVASLAHLELSDEEKASLTSDFSKILAYIEKINELKIDDIPQKFPAHELKNVFRTDEVGKSLDLKEVIELAPEEKLNQIKVPKFL